MGRECTHKNNIIINNEYFCVLLLFAGVLAYFCPCYIFGKTAEAVGDSCCLCGCAYLVYPFNIFARLHVRERIRQKKDLKVYNYITCLHDYIMDYVMEK